MDRSLVLRPLPPSLTETRGGRHLLVWGPLAQWLVVDDELRGFLAAFDGQRSIAQAIRHQARRLGKPRHLVETQAQPIIAQLQERGILSVGTATKTIAPEAVRIANVTINLTNRCNLRCRWCYNADHRTPEMPIAPLFDAIAAGRDVLDAKASLIILGGEPCLDPARLLAALARADTIFPVQTNVSTNGTLVDAELARRLRDHNVAVQISIDSPDAAPHDALRGEGTFARACAGVRQLVAAGVPALLSMVFTNQSAAEFEAYFELGRQLGVAEVRFIPLRRIGRGQTPAALAPDFVVIFRRLLEVLERRPEFQPMLRRDFFSILGAVCRFSTPRTNCGIGRKVIFVDADGKVYPCPNHLRPEQLCGDLHDADLCAVVRQSPVMVAMRETYQVSRYPRCRDCAFAHWCAGDCRGEVVAISGDPHAPSPHCTELQQVLKEMLWLVAGGDRRLGLQSPAPGGRAAADEFVV